MASTKHYSVCIVGAGISGLAAAYQAEKKGISYILLEASAQAGGVIGSENIDGFLVEKGPNSLLYDAEIAALISELNIENEVIEAQSVANNRFIFKDGRYQKLPSSPPSLLFSTFFSLRTKIKIVREWFYSARGTKEESLSSFFRRHFGDEILEYALRPFVNGIYAGNPDVMPIGQTFPSLLKMEETYGSILKGFVKNKTGERRKTVNFTKGLGTLVQAFEKRVKINYHEGVKEVKPRNEHFEIQTETHTYTSDTIIWACPSFVVADCLKDSFSEWSKALQKQKYTSMAALHLGFHSSEIGFRPEGFGGLHPKKEGLFTAGCIWNSSVFKGRAPEGETLFTVFIGGEQSASLQKPDEEVLTLALEEIVSLYKIQGVPSFQKIRYWKEALPVYDAELFAIERVVQDMESNGQFVCSNFIHGVSIPDCIKKGNESLHKVVKRLH